MIITLVGNRQIRAKCGVTAPHVGREPAVNGSVTWSLRIVLQRILNLQAGLQPGSERSNRSWVRLGQPRAPARQGALKLGAWPHPKGAAAANAAHLRDTLADPSRI